MSVVKAEGGMMRVGISVVSVLLILTGAVWVAQGTGIFPVGGMANVIKWAYYGSVLIVLGLLGLALEYRRRRPRPPGR